MEYKITVCGQSDAQDLCDRLVAFNLERVAPRQDQPFLPVRLKITDPEGAVIGGCLGEIYCWKVMSVDVLWVDPDHRGRGLGTALLGEMEQIAREQNCSLIHLDTFDFQARDFYLRQGYEVFGVLEDCPPGHCRYYLKKKLGSR